MPIITVRSVSNAINNAQNVGALNYTWPFLQRNTFSNNNHGTIQKTRGSYARNCSSHNQHVRGDGNPTYQGTDFKNGKKSYKSPLDTN